MRELYVYSTNLTEGDIGAKAYLKGDYGNKLAHGGEKNKANQTQFPQNLPWACHRSAQTNGCGMIISFVAS